MKNNAQTPLTKLLVNKGYKKVFTGRTNEIHIALDPITRNVCLLIANQGSQHFKELILPDEAIDYLFSIVYENCKYEEPTEGYKHTKLANAFIDIQGYKYITGTEREITNKEEAVTYKNETLIKDIKDEKIIGIIQMSHVNDIFANLITLNITYEEVAEFTKYIVETAKKAKEQQDAQKQENASKNEQDADVRPIENKEEK